MTDPLALLDEASWFDTIVDARPLHRVGRIRDDRAVYAVVDWTRTVGDLRRLLALARDAERLRGLLGHFVSLGWLMDSLPDDELAHDLYNYDRLSPEPKP